MKIVLLKLGVRNNNGRIYLKEKVEKTVSDFKDKIKRYGSVVGESFEHDGLDISLHNVSFFITDIYIDKLDRVIIDVKFANNEYGKFLKENIYDFVFISKGTGSISPDKTGHIIEDYTLITAFVSKKYDTNGNHMDAFYKVYTKKENRRDKIKYLLNDKDTEQGDTN